MKRRCSSNNESPKIDAGLEEKHWKLNVSNVVTAVETASKDCSDNDNNVCSLINWDEEWDDMHCNTVHQGLIVSVLAMKVSPSSSHFVVNADFGFFVTDPDRLVSGTTVVGSLFCHRRGVLQELFRMSESENTQMVIGTVVHYIFQQCLLDKSCKVLTHVETIARKVMKTKKVISSLYEVNLSTKEAFSLLGPYLNEIETFLNKYFHHSSIQTDTETIAICDVNDIEENIWCHHLGVKGRIDATVSVSRDATKKTFEIMPLELKTGRASYSFEHLGQLALYQMMMNLVGHEVDAGLLLYLKEGKCSRVTANRNMKRDLIILRNEVARSLSKWMVKDDLTQNGSFAMKPILPDPINNERACAKCPYNTVCITLLKSEREGTLTNCGLSILAEEACGHLRTKDVDYFIQWSGLIYLETHDETLQSLLLYNDDRCSQYRRIIIDREKPTFSDGFLSKSMIPKAKEILKKLNRHQKNAALKAAATKSYCLLKGLPGTGKTQTIVGLIRLLSLLGHSILLTSNTHSAVDNVLKRLLPFQDLKFIRLGSIDRIDPAVASSAEAIVTEHCDSPEKLSEVYEQYKIVGVTCQGTDHPLINKRIFDFCIVDEATQVFQPSLIRPLLRSKRFLLYRMNRVLTKLANEFAYNGKLICGNDIVENNTINLPKLENIRRIYEVERWLMKMISNQIDLSVVLVDTGNTYQMNLNYRKLNEISISITDDLSKNVTNCTNVSEIAIVVYIILFSCTKSSNLSDDTWINKGKEQSSHGYGILSDKSRLTVAITRAKEKLIIIGDRLTLNSYAPFKKLFNVASKTSNISLREKKDGFEWNALLEFLISLSD
uniref:DNA helicase n=1 Tax=Anopheles merus TaxID=30066 RepID=A0A182V8J4_ANOME